MKINSVTNVMNSAAVGGSSGAASAATVAASGTEQTPASTTPATPVEHADSIISSLKALADSVEFTVDKAAGKEVITIRDPKSGEVIRQLPSEEALKFARQMANGQGGLINQSA